METKWKENEIAKLAYDLTYHKYLLNRAQVPHLFSELTISEYVALHSIAKVTSDQSDSSERTYLKDLADYLEMPIHRASDMVGKLKERGFVIWSHSGSGSDGTYVIITDSGMQAMHRQEDILIAYFSRVIERFGQANLIHLLQQMKALEKIMDEEFSKQGGDFCGSDETE